LPFIPSSANNILDILNIPESERNFAGLNKVLKAGHKINEPKIIFPKLEVK
jgi:methionyl-tRNA synthetase